MENNAFRCNCGSELLMNYNGATLKFKCSECDFKHSVKIAMEQIADNGNQIGEAMSNIGK